MPRRNNSVIRIHSQYLKGAHLRRPFCVWSVLCVGVLLWTGAVSAAPLCPADRVDERAVVSKVFDGDTVELVDGRHVRFIGVNTPEVGHDDQPAEPLADAARTALEVLLQKDRNVLLRYDEEKFDVHRRTLAHVYLSDRSSVEAQLVADGLAFVIAIPPNLSSIECLHAQEQRARAARKGMWANNYFSPLDAQQVGTESLGFHRVKGTVQRVGQSKNSIWLNLSTRTALRIARDDLKYFTDYKPETLRGKTLIARGWIAQYKKGDFVMRVHHPAALEMQ